MATTWFTSDLHLGHDKEFIWKDRGFTSIQEHDETVIGNINSVVRSDDTLYILGDLFLYDFENGMKWLNRIICQDVRIIIGNHDTDNKINLIRELSFVTMIDFGGRYKFGKKKRFYLSHHPTLMDNNDSIWHRMYNLCGHTHTTDRFEKMNLGCYNVGLNAHNNMPVSIEEIVADIQQWRENYLRTKTKSLLS